MGYTYYLFPFSEVEKGEEIIIWGYGHVGVNYVEQILATGYCKIRMVVDKSWEKKKSSEVVIKAPEEIKKHKNVKIVIAHQSMNVVEQIKEQLLSWEIKEENIVSAIRKLQQGIKGNSLKRLEDGIWHIGKMMLSMESYVREDRYLSEKEKKHYQSVHDNLHLMRVKDKSYVRIGNKHDGGYAMLDDFQIGGVAYSFGIGADVSWDRNMAELGYDVYMYDHTIPDLPENNEKFHFTKCGIADSKENVKEDLKSLEYFLKQNKHEEEKNMILKMDVEGAEWGFLMNVEQSTLQKFDQIVFELHGLLNTDFTEKIVNALQKLSETHQLVHLHGNNYECIRNVRGCYFVEAVEVLFVRKDKYEFIEVERNDILDVDATCRKERLEVDLSKWNTYKIDVEWS